MKNVYVKNLIQTVIDNSESSDWENAVQEWGILDCEEDETVESCCICGKENIKYLFTIKNNSNGKTLSPIGSSCIKKFNRTDLNEITAITEGMFKLLHAIKENKFISLSPELFSRKILKALYQDGAFKENEYNNFNSKIDYDFILKMFNKKNKESITINQNKKIKAIIVGSIKPYLQEKLKNKIKSEV